MTRYAGPAKYTCPSSHPEAAQARFTTSATTESSQPPDIPSTPRQHSRPGNPRPAHPAEAAAATFHPNHSTTSAKARSCRRSCSSMPDASTAAGTPRISRGRSRLGMAAGIPRRVGRCTRSCSRCKRCAETEDGKMRRLLLITVSVDRPPRRSAKRALIGTTCTCCVIGSSARNSSRLGSSRAPSMRCSTRASPRRFSRTG